MAVTSGSWLVRAIGFALAISGVALAHVALADCNTDCKKACYKRRWGVKYDDPVCRAACEARKTACQKGVKIPAIPGVTDPSVIPPDPRELYYGSCGAIFNSLTGFVKAECGNYDDRMEDRQVIGDALEILVASRMFKSNELTGVRVRWCPLRGAEGMSPDRGLVFVDTEYRGAHVLDIAAVLAHELQHERQWRRHRDEFPCKYSEAYTACGGCQTRRNRFEGEAYSTEDRFWEAVNRVGKACETNFGRCPLQRRQYVGEVCECLLSRPSRGHWSDPGRVIP